MQVINERRAGSYCGAIAAFALSAVLLVWMPLQAQAQNPIDTIFRTIDTIQRQQQQQQQGQQQKPPQAQPQTQPQPQPQRVVPAPAQQPSLLVRGPSETKAIQGALQTLGFYSGIVDGSYGPGTTQAVTSWQAASRMPQTGWLTDDQFMSVIQEAANKRSATASVRAPFQWMNAFGQGTSVAAILNDTGSAVRFTCTTQGAIGNAGPGLWVDLKPVALQGESLIRFVVDGRDLPITLFDGSLHPRTAGEFNALAQVANALVGASGAAFTVEVPSRGARYNFSLANVRDVLRGQDGKTLADCPTPAQTGGSVNWSSLLGGWLDIDFKCERDVIDASPVALLLKSQSLDTMNPLGERDTCRVDAVSKVSASTLRITKSCPMSEEARPNVAFMVAEKLKVTRDPVERRKLSAELKDLQDPNKLYPHVNDFTLEGDVLIVRYLERQANGQLKESTGSATSYRRCDLVK